LRKNSLAPIVIPVVKSPLMNQATEQVIVVAITLQVSVFTKLFFTEATSYLKDPVRGCETVTGLHYCMTFTLCSFQVMVDRP
jgi:hypothetical protein